MDELSIKSVEGDDSTCKLKNLKSAPNFVSNFTHGVKRKIQDLEEQDGSIVVKEEPLFDGRSPCFDAYCPLMGTLRKMKEEGQKPLEDLVSFKEDPQFEFEEFKPFDLNFWPFPQETSNDVLRLQEECKKDSNSERQKASPSEDALSDENDFVGFLPSDLGRPDLYKLRKEFFSSFLKQSDVLEKKSACQQEKSVSRSSSTISLEKVLRYASIIRPCSVVLERESTFRLPRGVSREIPFKSLKNSGRKSKKNTSKNSTILRPCSDIRPEAFSKEERRSESLTKSSNKEIFPDLKVNDTRPTSPLVRGTNETESDSGPNLLKEDDHIGATSKEPEAAQNLCPNFFPSRMSLCTPRKRKSDLEVTEALNFPNEKWMQNLTASKNKHILQGNTKTKANQLNLDQETGINNPLSSVCASCKCPNQPKFIVRCQENQNNVPQYLTLRDDDSSFEGPSFSDVILKKIRSDPIGTLSKSDPFILEFGRRMWLNSFTPPIGKKRGNKVDISSFSRERFRPGIRGDYFDRSRQKVKDTMRRLASLYLAFKESEELLGEIPVKVGNSAELFSTKNFPHLETAIFSYVDKVIGNKNKNTLKHTLYYVIRNAACVLRNSFLAKEKGAEAQELKDFIDILEEKRDLILYGEKKICERKAISTKKPKPDQLTQDIRRLRSFSIKKVEEILSIPKKKFSSHLFTELRDLTLTRLMMFNAQLGEEPYRLTINEWEEAERNGWINVRPTKEFSPEKGFIFRLKIAFQTCKRSKLLVPVFFPEDTLPAMRRLVDASARNAACVHDHNVYAFPHAHFSLNHATQSHTVGRILENLKLKSAVSLVSRLIGRKASAMYASIDFPEDQESFFLSATGKSQNDRDVLQAQSALVEHVKEGKRYFQMEVQGTQSPQDGTPAGTDPHTTDQHSPLEAQAVSEEANLKTGRVSSPCAIWLTDEESDDADKGQDVKEVGRVSSPVAIWLTDEEPDADQRQDLLDAGVCPIPQDELGADPGTTDQQLPLEVRTVSEEANLETGRVSSPCAVWITDEESDDADQGQDVIDDTPEASTENEKPTEKSADLSNLKLANDPRPASPHDEYVPDTIEAESDPNHPKDNSLGVTNQEESENTKNGVSVLLNEDPKIPNLGREKDSKNEPRAILIETLKDENFNNNSDESFSVCILQKIRSDRIGVLSKRDAFILDFGRKMWLKCKMQENLNIFRRRLMFSMRRLASLHLEFKESEKRLGEIPVRTGNSTELFSSKNFFHLEASISSYSKNMFGNTNPSGKLCLKRALYYLIRNAATALRNSFLAEDNCSEAQKIKDFIDLLEERRHLILYGESKIRRSISFKIPKKVGLAQDVRRLRSHSTTRIEEILSIPKEDFNFIHFAELRDLALTRLAIFNAHQGNLPCGLTLNEWEESEGGGWIVAKCTNEFGAKSGFIFRLKVAFQTLEGCKRLVPVLIPEDTIPAVHKLVDAPTRNNCGILGGNFYVFPSGKNSFKRAIQLNSVNRICKHLRMRNISSLTAKWFSRKASAMYASLDFPDGQGNLIFSAAGKFEDDRDILQARSALVNLIKAGKRCFQIEGPKERPYNRWSSVEEKLLQKHFHLFIAGKEDATLPSEIFPSVIYV